MSFSIVDMDRDKGGDDARVVLSASAEDWRLAVALILTFVLDADRRLTHYTAIHESDALTIAARIQSAVEQETPEYEATETATLKMTAFEATRFCGLVTEYERFGYGPVRTRRPAPMPEADYRRLCAALESVRKEVLALRGLGD